MSETLKKGEMAEEILRNYFIELGYYVVRSIKFKYKSFDITDIDLWLYSKSSPFTRERTNVDIKNRKTPQAIERSFWTKGLQEILNLEKCIVVTTDSRSDVFDFGKLHNVTVLDGNFLNRIINREKKRVKERFLEEELLKIFEDDSIGDLYGNWKKHYEENKSILLREQNFNTCNTFLLKIKTLIEFYITSGGKETALRLLYLIISYFLISLDFSIKDINSKDEKQRYDIIMNNFLYGKDGKEESLKLINVSKKIISSLEPTLQSKLDTLDSVINDQFNKIKADVLATYFSKHQNASKIFEEALGFERNGYAMSLVNLNELPQSQKSIVAILCDFHGIDRKKIF